jgi:fatty acid desaturase
VTDAGLLERAYGYYLWRGLVSYALLGAGLLVALTLPRAPALTAAAALLVGVGLVQVAILCQDAGHLAVFRGARADQWLGMACWSLTAGVSFWYWCDRHNRHHSQTNDAEDDPDLAWTALIAVDEKQAAARRGWLRRVTPYQALLVAAIIPVLAFGLRLEGWAFAAQRLRGRRLALEAGLLGLNALAWATEIALGERWAAVFLGSQAMAGLYLFCAIAPNHKGMPIWARGARLSFPERQVLSSRNVTPHPVWDFAFGGLNYQIEHHLFPTMPRVRFGRARALVEPFCRANGLPYEESDPLSIYLALFAQAHRAGQAARGRLQGGAPAR